MEQTTTEREALRLELVKTASDEKAAAKAVAKLKVSWMAALAEQKAAKDTLADKVKGARSALDQANLRLGDSQTAQSRLRVEFTPKEIQQKEAALGFAFRTLRQKRKTADLDVEMMQEGIRARDRRRDAPKVDKETRQRESDRVVYLESVAAQLAEAEEGAKDSGMWSSVNRRPPMAKPRKPRPERVTTEALPGETPEAPPVVPLQQVPRVKCPRCDTKRVKRLSWRGVIRYYECNGEPTCADPTTGKAFRFKVMSV